MKEEKKDKPSIEGSQPEKEGAPEGLSHQETSPEEDDSHPSKKIIVVQDLDSLEGDFQKDPDYFGRTVEVDQKELEELRAKAQLAEKHISYAQRALADLENYRKRVQKEKEMAHLMTMKDMMGAFLPIIDNLERAIDAAGKTEKVEDLLEGLKIIENEISKFLYNQEMTPIEALGQPFDPHFHEAMGEIDGTDQKAGTVVHQITVGYQWRDMVLRHSQVMVARESKGGSEEEPSPSSEVPSSDPKAEDEGQSNES